MAAGDTRIPEKQQVEAVCLESLWWQKLCSLGWSEACTKRLLKTWAPTTLSMYNKYIDKFCMFLKHKGCDDITTVPENVLAEYLCNLSNASECPRSILNTTMAALSSFCEARDVKSLSSANVMSLINGLVKSGTVQPLQRSKVMPVNKFTKMFLSWPGNFILTLEWLRLKCVTLFALTTMMRPSDAVPLSKIWDPEIQDFKSMVLSTKNVNFHGDGSMTCVSRNQERLP